MRIPSAAVLILLTTVTALWLWMNRPPAGETDRIDSLAVLPLRNLTGDPDQQYFVDGMTEALTTDPWYLNLFGRNEEAAAEMKRAQQVDPLNPLWAAWIGDLNSYLGKYETAVWPRNRRSS